MSNNTPTTEKEWATDSDAEKATPSAGHSDLGWTTSDGTITGSPEKPTSALLNGWQNLVGQWVNLFANVIGNDQQDGNFDYKDLWHWDTSDVVGPATEPFVEQIDVDGTHLAWTSTQAGIGAANSWDQYRVDNCFGGLIYECINILNQGLVIEINDGGTSTWRIWKTTPASFSDFILEGNKNTGVSHKFGIPDTDTDSSIVINRITAGFLVVPTEFSFWTPLTSANFFTKNPGGVRVKMKGPVIYERGFTPANSSKVYFPNRVPIKRWIRPIENTSTNGQAAVSFSFLFRSMETGSRYKVILSLQANGGFSNKFEFRMGSVSASSQILIEVPDGLNKVSGETYIIDQEFMFNNNGGISFNQAGITMLGTGLDLFNTDTANIGTLYDGLNERLVILEELS